MKPKLISKIQVTGCSTCPLSTYHPLREHGRRTECSSPGRPPDPRILDGEDSRPPWCPLETRRVVVELKPS